MTTQVSLDDLISAKKTRAFGPPEEDKEFPKLLQAFEEADSFSNSLKRNEGQDLTKSAKEGIDRAYESSDLAWRERALAIIHKLCSGKASWCVDDVRRELEASEVKTHSLRAIAGVLRHAVKQGWCKVSVCPQCLNPITKETLKKSSHGRRVYVYESML